MNLIEILKVISDTNRLRVLNLLFEKELCVCELEYLLGISQSNLSKHLRVMSKLGILESRRNNKFVYYKIPENILKDHPFLDVMFKTERKKEAFLVIELNKLRDYEISSITCENVTALL